MLKSCGNAIYRIFKTSTSSNLNRMQRAATKNPTTAIETMLYYQTGVLLLLAAIFTLTFDKTAGISALLGGLTWLLPYFLSTKIMFYKFYPSPKPYDPVLLVKKFFLSQAVKFLASIVCIILCLKFISLYNGIFLIGYVISILTVWLTPLVVKAPDQKLSFD